MRIAVLALLLWSIPATALGHGRFPELGRMAFHPSDDDVILVRGTFGLVATDDGGATFRWVCPTVYGGRWTEDPAITIAADGSFIVGIFDGLARGTGGGCDWGFPSTDLTDEVVIDVDRSGDATIVYALTSSGGRDNELYASSDDGVTWAATGPSIDPILFETVRVAPSDPSQIYLTGAYPPTADMPRRPFVYTSDDAGVTWTAVAFTDFRDGDRNVYLLGVDPSNPQRTLIRVRADEDDRVYESTDGGATFSEVFSLASADAFAWSDDGSTVWIGGRIDTSLHRSDDGGRTFTQVRDDLTVSCIGLRGAELFVCADNYAEGFALGRSTDDGVTIDPLLVFADLDGLVMCGADADTPTVCTDELDDLALDLGLPIDGGVPIDGGTLLDGAVDSGTVDSGVDAAPDTGFDGSRPDTGTDPGGGDGCGCRTSPGRDGGWPWLALATLAILGRHRRPRAARTSSC